MSANVRSKRSSVKRQKAIAALMTERTLVDAAQKAGIGERQLRRWMRDPEFQSELQAVATQATDTAVRRLTSLTGEAIDTLKWAMGEATEHDHARVRAALGVLANFTRLKELLEVEIRLAAIEAMLQGGKRPMNEKGKEQ